MAESPEGVVQRYELNIAAAVPTAGKHRELRVLSGLNDLVDVLRQRTGEIVAICREHGATWDEIGTSLDVSRQAAHERFASNGGTA
ncbi:MAG TPA: hypothetical protein VIY28_06340 [Pseudonocardiaceae bacterium]